MTARQDLAAAGKLLENVSLAPLTTYRFGGPARYLVEADTEQDLIAAAALATSEHLPVVVLGRGSNMVVSDRGFAGVVIRQGSGFSRRETDSSGVVIAGAAVPLPMLARETARWSRWSRVLRGDTGERGWCRANERGMPWERHGERAHHSAGSLACVRNSGGPISR